MKNQSEVGIIVVDKNNLSRKTLQPFFGFPLRIGIGINADERAKRINFL